MKTTLLPTTCQQVQGPLEVKRGWAKMLESNGDEGGVRLAEGVFNWPQIS